MLPRRSVRCLTAAAAALLSFSAAGAAVSASPPSQHPGHQRVATTGLIATFDSGSQGWTTYGSGGPITWVSVGGDPGGHIAATTGADASVQAARSPASWGGDRRSLYGGQLRFDTHFDPGGSTSSYQITMRKAGSTELLIKSLHDPSGTVADWTPAELDVDAAAGWAYYDGTTSDTATAADFDRVLGDLGTMEISTFDQTGSSLYLDNITLAGPVDRTLTLALKGSRFYGRVKPSGGCATGQRVDIFRTRPGPDAAVGKARTDDAGEFGLRAKDPRKGTYYATVAAGFVEGGGDCSAAKSKGVRVR